MEYLYRRRKAMIDGLFVLQPCPLRFHFFLIIVASFDIFARGIEQFLDFRNFSDA